MFKCITMCQLYINYKILLNIYNKNKFIKIGLTTSDNLKWSIIID